LKFLVARFWRNPSSLKLLILWLAPSFGGALFVWTC